MVQIILSRGAIAFKHIDSPLICCQAHTAKQCDNQSTLTACYMNMSSYQSQIKKLILISYS
jgi:hypothetical protein